MLIRDASELPERGVVDAPLVAIDCETYDPRLKTLGPGDVRGDGHVAGIGVAVEHGPRLYIPTGHETGPRVDREAVARWLADQIGGRKHPIVGANLNYDRGWLYADLGVDLVGVPAHDVQVAEPLLDETKSSYSLDATARDYGFDHGKPDDEFYAALAEQFGGRATRRQQGGNIWRADPGDDVTYNYVMGDVDLPLSIIRAQYDRLRELGLVDAFRRETVVLDIVLLMRRRGVRVDTDRAEQVKQRLAAEIDGIQDKLGVSSLWAPEELGRLCERHGHTPSRTAKKQTPSVTKSYLQRLEQGGEQFAADLLRARKLDHALNTFIQSYVLDFVASDGRIHGQFHQLRGNDDEDRGMSGAITGRFSSSTPNLQNIPSRDPEMGPLVRSLWLPDDGHTWVSHDYEQIEPRLTLHYATGAEAEAERAAYHDDPARDCYATMIDALRDEPALQEFKEVRKPVKNVWLGLLYGMGKPKLCDVYLNVDRERGDEIIRVFNEAAPYVDRLKRDVQRVAKRRGWLRTIGGRRANFPLWEPADFDTKFERSDGAQRFPPQRDPVTMRQWLGEAGRPTRVSRAWAHKALNKLIQGGAADLMKAAMVAQYEAGVFDVLGPPLVTVHDELDWSVPPTREGDDAVAEARRLMAEPGIALNLPLLVGEERGPNWGELEGVEQ